MSDRDRRIEPTFELEPLDPPTSPRSETFGAEPRRVEPEFNDRGPHFSVRLTLFAITTACLVFIIDIGLDRAIEYRTTRQIQQEAQALLDEMEQSAANEQARQELQIQRQRAARAQTTPGKWLAKNCSDWTRAWNQLKAPTAEIERKKHCGRYETYLATGVAPRDAPRAGSR